MYLPMCLNTVENLLLLFNPLPRLLEVGYAEIMHTQREKTNNLK